MDLNELRKELNGISPGVPGIDALKTVCAALIDELERTRDIGTVTRARLYDLAGRGQRAEWEEADAG